EWPNCVSTSALSRRISTSTWGRSAPCCRPTSRLMFRRLRPGSPGASGGKPGRRSSRMPERTSAIQAGTRRTVVTAGLANLAVLLIKAVAGVLSGSSAMLAEAAHSAADTLNQGFLLASLKRSQRPADDEHPFGYGQERYFWSLLAAFGIFVAGAGFSVFEGVLALSKGGSSHDVVIAY